MFDKSKNIINIFLFQALIGKANFCFIIFIILFSFLFSSCGIKPSPEKLPLSVKSNFALLHKDPQFVMYLNFKSMRTTGFWKEFVSDSILSAENTLGNLLNSFKTATGATISNGLDELYYSNTWLGTNAIVLKGIFDKSKIDSYLEKDTLISKNLRPDRSTIYTFKNNNLMFFFKDNFTLCASNYPAQIDDMLGVKDTSNTGLLQNAEMLKVIDELIYKEELFMVTAEKTFIRGIFANFVESKLSKSNKSNVPLDTSDSKSDTLSKTDELMMNKIYKNINSIGFSAKMKDDLNFIIQFSCVDEKSSEYLDKLFSGLITLSRLTSSAKKEKNPSATEKILDAMEIKTYGNSLMVYIKINKDNINEFRKNTLLSQPN